VYRFAGLSLNVGDVIGQPDKQTAQLKAFTEGQAEPDGVLRCLVVEVGHHAGRRWCGAGPGLPVAEGPGRVHLQPVRRPVQVGADTVEMGAGGAAFESRHMDVCVRGSRRWDRDVRWR
jgi:hypothetical protein